MDVVLGQNVTLTTLLNKPDYTFIVWNFNNGKVQVHVATRTQSGLNAKYPYLDRVSIDGATGNLFLKESTSADSGDYAINVVSADGDTQTSEIKLRVLGESFRWVPGPRLGDLAHLPPPNSQLFIVLSGATNSGFMSLLCAPLEVTCCSDAHA